MTFLAIDVGNTRLKWALYSAPRPDAHVLAHGAEFLENIDRLAETDWACLPTPTSMLGCVVAGEAVRRRVQEQMELWDITPQWVVSSAEESGLTNGYDHPSRLGADRWVAMVGARHRMLGQGAPRPMVVVMVGTAVTVEAVDAEGGPGQQADVFAAGGWAVPVFGAVRGAFGRAGKVAPENDVAEQGVAGFGEGVVGGGFGGKLFIRADAVLAALAAKEVGRPVKIALLPI